MRATASAAHARHYGIKDSKASSDLSERIATDVSARHFSAGGLPVGGPVKSGAGFTMRARCRRRCSFHTQSIAFHRNPPRPNQPSAGRPIKRAGRCFALIVTGDTPSSSGPQPPFETRTTHTKFCMIQPSFRRSRLFSSAAHLTIFVAFRCPRGATPATRSTRYSAALRPTTGSRCAPSASACGKFACAMRAARSGSSTSRHSPMPPTCFTASGNNRHARANPISAWPPGVIAR
ncbi:hypothetical protein BAR24066_01638 [Burkholderia arboris]|uniref:Uncharacterized protein n=1 Tax=Burkholderia arboris TaxID=488730 RepID=A0A9Q9UPH8_9BURK|nr:hypothetical protein BAR24066_01638 [Burkholderia arboris]